MSDNPMTPKSMQSLLYDNFSDVCETAVSRVASDAEGNDVYVVVIRTNSKNQEVPDAGLVQNGAPEVPDDLDLALSKQIGGLLQQTKMWDVTKDKRHCSGPTPIARPRKAHGEPRVPAHWANLAQEGAASLGNGDDLPGMLKSIAKDDVCAASPSGAEGADVNPGTGNQ